jgi:hypothetical protein
MFKEIKFNNWSFNGKFSVSLNMPGLAFATLGLKFVPELSAYFVGLSFRIFFLRC